MAEGRWVGSIQPGDTVIVQIKNRYVRVVHTDEAVYEGWSDDSRATLVVQKVTGCNHQDQLCRKCVAEWAADYYIELPEELIALVRELA